MQNPDGVHLMGWIGERIKANEGNRLAKLDTDRLLEGYRGHPPADVDALQQVLLRISYLVERIPEISELDLNPVFALPPGKGCLVVDARIRLRAK